MIKSAVILHESNKFGTEYRKGQDGITKIEWNGDDATTYLTIHYPKTQDNYPLHRVHSWTTTGTK